MGEWKLLPLGVDVGTTRARIACSEVSRGGAVRVRAIVARDVADESVSAVVVRQPELVAAVIEEMLAEIGTRERRCVLALGAPASVLRTVRFPGMSWPERLRASRFEAQRFAGWDLDEPGSIVRTHAFDRLAGTFAVGVTREERIDSRVQTVRCAGLRPVAVDHDAFAIRRLFPECDAIVDVGAERSSIHCFADAVPSSLVAHVGGASITRGIAADLSIDFTAAEHRKRILGCAGAGIAASEDVVAAIGALIDRARSRVPVERIVITGNGARLPNFACALEAATGAAAEMPVPEFLHTAAYPEDVVRAAAPDWGLAASLTLWGVAA